MKRVAIAGATGFIGQALAGALARRGDEPVALIREGSKTARTVPQGIRVARYDSAHPQPAALEKFDALVNLAGETLAGYWTSAKKRRIYDSRVSTTRALVAALKACQPPPPVMVSASAVGYYGSQGDRALDESAPPGNDFLARVCIDWERESAAAESAGIRSVQLRQGIVVGRGGAVKAMLTPFKLGLGGPLGSGQQWWPWVHIDDDVRMILYAIDNPGIRGAVNSVSPDPVTNARFTKALAAALHRPAFVRAPAFGLKLLLGQFAESLLASQRVIPARARQLGFVFSHENIEQAMLDIFARI
jgi:uncharacterized protein